MITSEEFMQSCLVISALVIGVNSKLEHCSWEQAQNAFFRFVILPYEHSRIFRQKANLIMNCVRFATASEAKKLLKIRNERWYQIGSAFLVSEIVVILQLVGKNFEKKLMTCGSRSEGVIFSFKRIF
eukprot:TRINITY_DN4363_c2_g1_i1.p4 TRINITY_DN4363_c2_g1~~TRINITY_DN4363_c2_g1_i1.p4  ORF type:complete len:127 (-),score=5.94 TRINITY_DN4363_c2_g1_i1:929-1309(-)